MKRLVRFFALLSAVLLSGSVLPTQANPGHESALATVVQQYLRVQTQGLPGRVETSIGQLDPRTQLSPCSAMEPFTPPGNRLWGKTMVGVRCLGPANWTIYVPVNVRVNGSYVVTSRPLSAGQIVGEEDLSTRQGDLASLPTGVVTAPSQAIGKSLKNSLGGGQPLRADALLSPPVVLQGQDVRLIYKGSGFAVSNEGKALNNAADGQVARARTGNGQTVSGIARPGGIIEIGP